MAIERAEQIYFIDKGNHTSQLEDLVGEGYIKSLSTCPSAGVYSRDETEEDFYSTITCSIHGSER